MQAWGLNPVEKFLMMYRIAWDRPGTQLGYSLLYQKFLPQYHWYQVWLLRNLLRVVLQELHNHDWILHKGVINTILTTSFLTFVRQQCVKHHGGLANPQMVAHFCIKASVASTSGSGLQWRSCFVRHDVNKSTSSGLITASTVSTGTLSPVAAAPHCSGLLVGLWVQLARKMLCLESNSPLRAPGPDCYCELAQGSGHYALFLIYITHCCNVVHLQ